VCVLPLEGLSPFPLEAAIDGLLRLKRGKRKAFFPLACVAVAPVAVVVEGRSLTLTNITEDCSDIRASFPNEADVLVDVMLRMLSFFTRNR
jgi:hypothetical protein